MPVGVEDGVLATEVSTEELVGTIQQVETHDEDPTTVEGMDPWDTFHDKLGGLGDRLKSTYRRVADEDGPSEEEIRQALTTLAGAWSTVADSIGDALRDPDVRQRLKEAASSFATAVGRTISELGVELRESNGWPQRDDEREEE